MVTVVAEPRSNTVVVWTGFPLAGALVAVGLGYAADWLTTWSWVPFHGVIRLVSSIPDPQRLLVAIAVGLVLGVVVAVIAHRERLTVTASDERITLVSAELAQQFPRDSVSAVFRDRKQLVVLGSHSDELARRQCDLPADELAGALRAHGYPWADADPFADDFRRWVPDVHGLPAGARALLAAREKRLGTADAKELRVELARLGVVVRDEGKRQYWRLTDRVE